MKHFEAKVKDLEVELWQQRNLNRALEKMLRELIVKFKKQKNKIKNKLAKTSDAKDELAAYVKETEENLVDMLTREVKYKAKAQRHKKKNIKYTDKYLACEKNLTEAKADNLYDDRERAYDYLQYCVVGWKYRFKQWWIGIYYIDKLRDKL